jgi:methionyl-tRNA formyltransferase
VNTNLNFIFWGTPDVASETLEILKMNGYVPSLIVTSPDKPQGRKMLMTPPPAKVWAEANNIPFIQPENLSREGLSFTDNLDLFIVAAYGKIIPEDILNIPKLGSINVHYSLLPKYRGASPVESAILNGDTITGVSIQKMVYKMDAGDVIASLETNINPAETAPELRKRLIALGGELLVKILPDFTEGKIAPITQNETLATNCHKIKKEDGLLDLTAPGEINYRKYRAYSHWPRVFIFDENKKRIIITKAKLEKGEFVIEKFIPEGGKEQEYKTSI